MNLCLNMFDFFTDTAGHCVKVPVFGVILEYILRSYSLYSERRFVSLRIESKCGKMWTRITPNTDTFYAVGSCSTCLKFFPKL